VTELLPAADGRSVSTVVARDVATGSSNAYPCDGVVFAVGITGMQVRVMVVSAVGINLGFQRLASTLVEGGSCRGHSSRRLLCPPCPL
jgi:hypothetical protein